MDRDVNACINLLIKLGLTSSAQLPRDDLMNQTADVSYEPKDVDKSGKGKRRSRKRRVNIHLP
ncbi:MAG: hypothetical protein DRN04_11140 [Thermoprotei archaeon]|nr:MAG: hypothetical protein DRN04_11140 [Thermoprotei archaeon]